MIVNPRTHRHSARLFRRSEGTTAQGHCTVGSMGLLLTECVGRLQAIGTHVFHVPPVCGTAIQCVKTLIVGGSIILQKDGNSIKTGRKEGSVSNWKKKRKKMTK